MSHAPHELQASHSMHTLNWVWVVTMAASLLLLSFVILLILILFLPPRMKKLSGSWQWVPGLSQNLLSQSKTLLRWSLMWRAWRKQWWNLRWPHMFMFPTSNPPFSHYIIIIQPEASFLQSRVHHTSQKSVWVLDQPYNKGKSLTRICQALEIVT